MSIACGTADAGASVAAKYGALLESMPDAIVLADAAGLIVLANGRAEQLFGYAAGELHGRPIEILLPTHLRQAHVAHRSSFFAQPRVRSMGVGLELNGVHNDGTEFAVEISLSPIVTEGSTLVMSAIRDISERKLIEQMLVEKNAELQSAAQAKDRFLANMSHELRTPLNGIIGFAQLMHSGKLGPLAEPHQEYLGDILTSARHLLQLINTVLDLAKFGAGKVELSAAAIDLAGLVAEVCDGLRAVAAEKHIVFQVDVAELADVIGDAAKIKQILYNYLSNAVKFSADGGSVGIRCRVEGGDYFRIEVEDNGIGIPHQDLARLFVEFQQLDATSAKRYQGAGLGLALTKALAEAQGGRVEVHSIVGKGSVFSAVLPRGLGVPCHAAAPAPAPSTAPETRGISVLVIEDTPEDARYLARVLGDAGYDVVTAATGREAVGLAKQRHFALMTLDLLLPDMRAANVLDAVRATTLNSDIKSVVVSVVGDGSIGKSMGVTDLLQKPVDPRKLLESLRRAGAENSAASILVVDDDTIALELVRIALHGAGYHVVCTHDPVAALELLKHEPFDAFIVDLMMPKMTGFELIERIRALPRTRCKPVIVWSAKDLDSEDRARLKQGPSLRIGERASGVTSLIEELRRMISDDQPVSDAPAATQEREHYCVG